MIIKQAAQTGQKEEKRTFVVLDDDGVIWFIVWDDSESEHWSAGIQITGRFPDPGGVARSLVSYLPVVQLMSGAIHAITQTIHTETKRHAADLAVTT